jgi:sulfur carrier protein
MTTEMTNHRIQIWVNQVATELTMPAYLSDAINAVDIKPPFAAAVNLHFVPKKNYTSHALQAGDKIELIVPVTGG